MLPLNCFSDRISQVYHFRNWQYICIDLLANKRASITPNIAWSVDRPIRGATVKACQRSLMNAKGEGFGGEPFVGANVAKRTAKPLFREGVEWNDRGENGQLVDWSRAKETTTWGNYVGMDGYDRDAHTPLGFSGGGHSFLTMGEWRSKALSVVEPHENLMPIEAEHPLPRLMKNPNPVDTAFDVDYELFMFGGLCGIAYEWTPKNRWGQPCERWCIPSHWVYPRTGAGQYVPFNHEYADELIWDYEIRPWGYPGYAGVLHFPPDEVIVYRCKHPLSKIDGWAKLAAGAQIIDLEEATTQTQWSQMINQGVPSMVVKAPPGYGDWDDNEIARNEAKFFQRVQGAFNYNKPMFVPAGTDIEPWGYNPTEMAYQSGQDQARDRVLALWHMPKSALGLVEGMTYGSVMATLGSLCVFEINPHLTSVGQTRTKHLASQFDEKAPAFSTMSGGGYGSSASVRRAKIFYDDCVPADPQQVNSDIQLDIQANAITPNEIRALRGRQPYRRGGDNPIVNGPGGPMPLVINAPEDVDDMAEIIARMTQAEGKETGQQQAEDVDTTAQARVESSRDRGETAEDQPLDRVRERHGGSGLEPPETTSSQPSKSSRKLEDAAEHSRLLDIWIQGRSQGQNAPAYQDADRDNPYHSGTREYDAWKAGFKQRKFPFDYAPRPSKAVAKAARSRSGDYLVRSDDLVSLAREFEESEALERRKQRQAKRRELALSQKQPINVTVPVSIQQPAPSVSVPVTVEKDSPAAPIVNVAAPVVHVGAPVVNVPEQQAPVVNVAAPIVNVPPASPAVVNVPAPIVKVEAPVQVNVPEQPAPVVNSVVNVPEAQVVVNVPQQLPPVVQFNAPAASKRSRRVERDDEGRVLRIIDEFAEDGRPEEID